MRKKNQRIKNVLKYEAKCVVYFYGRITRLQNLIYSWFSASKAFILNHAIVSMLIFIAFATMAAKWKCDFSMSLQKSHQAAHKTEEVIAEGNADKSDECESIKWSII